MAQAKKKQSTKTAKKVAAKPNCARKKACTRTCKKQQSNQSDKVHVYLITAMSMVAAILLCANVAMMVA